MFRKMLFSGVENGNCVGRRNQEFNTKRGSQRESELEMHREGGRGGDTFHVRFKQGLSSGCRHFKQVIWLAVILSCFSALATFFFAVPNYKALDIVHITIYHQISIYPGEFRGPTANELHLKNAHLVHSCILLLDIIQKGIPIK